MGNIFTLFNLINTILLVCIIISGSLKNALFYLVVLWNFLIGTIQEIRAKKTIDKLSLISAPKAHVIRDGTDIEINVNDIVLGDIMVLNTGNQICADAVVIDGSCQVNESLVTGESDAIYKSSGDNILSGSFLVSGRVYAEVEHVGEDNYANKITSGAKQYKKPDSVIMKSVSSIIRALVICIIPLSALFIWNNFFRLDLGFSPAMVKTVAAVSSMIPGGLVLLVSIVLSVSVIRLSAHKTMVQDLYCVENLARVDTLLLDKTGTITEGIMKAEEILHINENLPAGIKDLNIDAVIRTFALKSTDSNPTIEAVRDYFASYDAESVYFDDCSSHFIPFSSERKFSMLCVDGTGSFLMGAPEFILDDMSRVSDCIASYAEKMKRVVVFAWSPEIPDIRAEGDFKKPDNIFALSLIVIGDRIRENAPATLKFFRDEDVDIKIISGDSPITVSGIAAQAGLLNADKWVDASILKDEADIEAAVDKYTVFGRVTPHQKCDIVKALKKKGHTVAMTGDGANDVLALRESDCSIAMQSGTDAARNAANLVLLNSDFSSLPLVVAEGRKSINNLQRSAALYITKTVFSMVLTAFFIFASSVVYPFESIQMTLIGAIGIGIPSFFLALEPNNNRIKKGFLANVAKTAVPTGIMEGGALIVLTYMLKNIGADSAQTAAAATYMMLILGIAVVFNICGKVNLFKIGLIVLLAAAAAGACLVLPKVFSLVPLNPQIWGIILIISAVFFAVHFVVFRIIMPEMRGKSEKNHN
ncbi:MAG: HAD-IC family P-type ATPase [Parasporobacterium sp.]|nr:HAD-IC family P-type ATPase [Parasporobacterium sp.]